MKDYGQIITKMGDTPWMITEGGLRMIFQVVESHLSGDISLEEIRARTEGGQRNRGSLPQQQGAVGVLPLHGPIFPKANLMTELSGATSMEQFQQDFRAMLQNDRISSILLDIDSPGGSSSMIREMSDEIREARETKPIYAIANTMAASAAYMLGASASELYVSDSGYVGSVGVYLVHTDASQLMEKAGVRETVIKEGRFKAALITPLTEETRANLQETVTDCYDQFVEAVALGRNTTTDDVLQNYGEGGVVSANKALEARMVDGVRTYDEVLTALLDGGGTVVQSENNNGGGSFFSLRASFDKEKEHSEPGTGQGGEPEPRKPPDSEDEDNWREKGHRWNQPHYPPEESVMNREMLLKYATRLSIDATDLTDEELATKVQEGLDAKLELVDELDSATESAKKRLAFAQDYPEEAERLRKLEESEHETSATKFANKLASYSISEGEGDSQKITNFRLSTLAQERVKEAHIKLAQGNLVPDDLEKLVQTVATGGVQQGEEGSSRFEETDDLTVPTKRREIRKLFAEKVEELMKNDNLDRKAAMAEAGKRYPELAEAYLTS